MPCGAQVETSSWQKRLGDRVLCVLHAPGAQMLGESGYRQSIAEFVLQAAIGRRAEILFHKWPEQQVASGVSRDERSAAPWSSHRELNVSEQVARVKTLLGKGPGFALRRSRE